LTTYNNIPGTFFSYERNLINNSGLQNSGTRTKVGCFLQTDIEKAPENLEMELLNFLHQKSSETKMQDFYPYLSKEFLYSSLLD
jgi:hypothetical protein